MRVPRGGKGLSEQRMRVNAFIQVGWIVSTSFLAGPSLGEDAGASSGATPQPATFPVGEHLQGVPGLGQTDRIVLSSVRDGTRMIDEAGLYLLLEHAARSTTEELVRQAVAVRRADLIDHPQAYRGRLVKVHATYAETQPFRPSNRRRYGGIAYSTLAVESEGEGPMAIVTVDDPGRLRRGADVVLAGYFFKLRLAEAREPDPQTGATELIVPVLVGRAVVVEPRPPGRIDDAAFSSLVLVGGVVLLAALWLVLRVRINRRRPESRCDRLRSRRQLASQDPGAPENWPVDLDALQTGAAESAGKRAGPLPGAGGDGDESDAAGQAGRLCAKCGSANRVGAWYCDQCGYALNDEQAADGG